MDRDLDIYTNSVLDQQITRNGIRLFPRLSRIVDAIVLWRAGHDKRGVSTSRSRLV